MASKMRELGLMVAAEGGGGRGRRSSRKHTAREPVSEEEEAAAAGKNSRQRDGRRERKKRREKKNNLSSSETGQGDVPRLVMSLSCRGYEEELAWLEAYLRDEARDRTVDGGYLGGVISLTSDL